VGFAAIGAAITLDEISRDRSPARIPHAGGTMTGLAAARCGLSIVGSTDEEQR
jgi:hypothetical protein